MIGKTPVGEGNAMEKREQIAHLAANDDEAVLLARVYERIDMAERRSIPAATGFLTLREQLLCRQLLSGREVTFFGGYDAAERKVCVYLPEYLGESWLSGEDSPVAAIRATYFEKDALTHRDILGALMGCGIKRETVGDIFVAQGRAEFFLTTQIAPYVLQNFTSAGRTKLHVERIPLAGVTPPELKTKRIRDTLASLRLDAVISSGFGLARGKAAALVEAGKAELNGAVCVKPDHAISEGDVIAARGLGKIKLEEVGGLSRKARLAVSILRYL